MAMRHLALPLALLLAACAPTPSQPAATITPVASVRPPDGSTGAATNPQPPASVPPSPVPSATPTATPPSASPTPVPVADGLRYVAFGASDVVGLGASDPAKEGWAPVSADLLGERLGRRIDLTKVGVLARTAAQMREFDLEKVVEAKPEVVVLWTGANDLRSGVALPDFREDYGAILDAIAATKARLYVLNVPDLDRLPFFAEYKDEYKAVMPDWQRAIREDGQARGATVIDLAAFSGELEANPDYLWVDGFHPSAKGYRRLAEIVVAAIGKDLPAAR